jgi:hypothetical protein
VDAQDTAEAVRPTAAPEGAAGRSMSPASEEALRGEPAGGRTRGILLHSRGSELPKTHSGASENRRDRGRVFGPKSESLLAGRFIPRRRSAPPKRTPEGEADSLHKGGPVRDPKVVQRGHREQDGTSVPKDSAASLGPCASAVLGTQHHERIARPLESLYSFFSV